MLVTGGPPVRGGGGMPQRIIVSSAMSVLVQVSSIEDQTARVRRGLDILSTGLAAGLRWDDRVRQPPRFFLKLSFSAWTNSHTER
jgi:hypothetical protein